MELRQRLSDLLKNARRNDQLFAKTRRLILALVEAENWLAIQAALDDVLQKILPSIIGPWCTLPSVSLTRAFDCARRAAKRALLRLFKGVMLCAGNFSQAEMAALWALEQTSARSGQRLRKFAVKLTLVFWR